MKTFKTEAEMLKYGKSFTKYDIKTVICDGKKIVLCGAGSSFEDSIWKIAEEALSKTAKVFIEKNIVDNAIENDFGCETGATPEIRDFILEKTKKIFDFNIVTIKNEF